MGSRRVSLSGIIDFNICTMSGHWETFGGKQFQRLLLWAIIARVVEFKKRNSLYKIMYELCSIETSFFLTSDELVAEY